MALFKRNKTESVMPEEVRDFYAAERRQRKGTAWLLAIATLLVTFLLAALLFFGGRWVYRAIFDKKDTAPSSQTESSQEQKKEEQAERSTAPTSNSDQGATSGNSAPNSSTAPQTGSTGTQPATTGSSSTQSIPATGPSELINTGPGDE